MSASDDIDAAWSFDLPDAAIARYPTEDRAASRLKQSCRWLRPC